jgi:hemerythrin-like metal-binding protein
MKSGRSKEAFEPLFDGLIDYTTIHFRAEEKLMQEHSYLSYIAHHKGHLQLITQVLELREKYKQGDIGLGVELLVFLTKWLQHHIKGTDKQYGVFFNAKGIH